VAGFLGISNLLHGEVAGDGRVRLEGGADLHVSAERLPKSGAVAVGVRPEKLLVGGGEVNRLDGTVAERAYVGVSTQYIVDTPAGALTVYVQNADRAASSLQPGDPIALAFAPESAFVLDHTEETA
jgi:spermidine/putrescine transport system ATP-binding protein